MLSLMVLLSSSVATATAVSYRLLLQLKHNSPIPHDFKLRNKRTTIKRLAPGAGLFFYLYNLGILLSWNFAFRCRGMLNQAWPCYCRGAFGKQKHRTSLRQTSVLSMQNIRNFAQRSPMFCFFRNTVCFFLQKKFLKISYISYTHSQNVLYLLTLLGVG